MRLFVIDFSTSSYNNNNFIQFFFLMYFKYLYQNEITLLIYHIQYLLRINVMLKFHDFFSLPDFFLM